MAFPRYFLAIAIAAGALLAAGAEPKFDVATVKPSGPDVTTRRFTIQGRRFLTYNTTLADLIQFAYGLHPRQLSGGPEWIGSNRFDVVGSASGEGQPTEQEWMKMMANLVAERFHLRYRLEKRDLSVYAVRVDRNGPKLELGADGPDVRPALAFHGRGELVARNANIADLAWELQSAVLDKPVVDQSGLTNRFNFTLSWMPDEFQTPALAAGTGPRTAEETAPSLFTAVRQQLGLQLTAAKAKVDVMVIEQVSLPGAD